MDFSAKMFLGDIEITSVSTFLGENLVMVNPIPLDNDAQNFLTATNLTSNEQITIAINNLVTNLKNNGLWTKMYAIYPFVGGTSETTKYNLINTGSYTLLYTGSINYTTNGISGSGNLTDKGWANTQIFCSTGSFSDWATSNSMGVYVRTNVTGGYDAGAENAGPSNDIALNSRYVNNFAYYLVGSLLQIGSITEARGFTIGTISGSSGVNHWIYKNGSSIASTSNSVGISNNERSLYLGANNSTTEGINEPSYRQYAYFFVGKGLTPTDVSNYNTIVQTFQTELGRAV